MCQEPHDFTFVHLIKLRQKELVKISSTSLDNVITGSSSSLSIPSVCRVHVALSYHDIATDKDQTTTPEALCPTLCDKCVGSLTSPADHNGEDAGDGAYGLPSLSEKTRTSNHLQMSLQRRHILLSYFKTLSVGPVWGLNLRPSTHMTVWHSTNCYCCKINLIMYGVPLFVHSK